MVICLNRSTIFKGLTDEQFANLIGKGRRITLQPKSVLFNQGDSAEQCYLVYKGCLKLTKLNEQGREVILRYISASEVTAITAVLKDQPYPATAACVEKTEVVGWDKKTMLELMLQYSIIAINLLGIVFDRIDEVQNRYLEVCTEHVDQRIARSLLRFMRKAGVKTSEGIHIDMLLSRENIADYSGTTLYTVSRTLSSWEKKGWIISRREKVIIKDPHALVLFAEGV